MPNIKTGQEVPCFVCNKMVYKTRAYLARGYQRITCVSSECKSAKFQGENNPFWGRSHNDDSRNKIKATKKANPTLGRTGPPKGYRHTPEARDKIRGALLQRWTENRDAMVARLPRGKDHHYHKEPEFRRYRKNFSPVQRREWTGTECVWCKSTKRLNLDHIIPVFDGGINHKANSQTLCHPCNLWKLQFVDKPRYLAGLGSKEGQI